MLDRLDDLSPRFEPVAVGVALADITGLGPMLGEERRMAARAVALCREVSPLPVRVGAAENRWLAVLAARLAQPERPDAPAAFRALARETLAELPLDLLPADPATRQRFALFGLTVMGQLATLPRSAVGAQFGVVGERLQLLARGDDPRPLAPRRRPARLPAPSSSIRPWREWAPSLWPCVAPAPSCARCCGHATWLPAARPAAAAGGRARLWRGAVFPGPALEPDWIARLLLGRLEQAARARRLGEVEEPRVGSIGLVFDRLADPASRQLPAFEAQAARWEELRWSLERLAARFGEGRLWRAVHDRPTASLAERRTRLVDIGPSAS